MKSQDRESLRANYWQAVTTAASNQGNNAGELAIAEMIKARLYETAHPDFKAKTPFSEYQVSS